MSSSAATSAVFAMPVGKFDALSERFTEFEALQLEAFPTPKPIVGQDPTLVGRLSGMLPTSLT